MANIQVSLAGSPEARFNGVSVSLRSRQTWGLLASLLLEPQTDHRAMLAARFWPDGRDDRNSLTMALASIKAAFGADTVIADRHTVRLDRARFVTDLDRLDAALAEAQEADGAFTRKTILTEAATLLRGRFLEGADYGDDADGFFARGQARLTQGGADVLVALSAAQEQTGDLGAAFDTLLRALRIAPENAAAAQALHRVARAMGNESAARQLLAEIGAKDAARLPPAKSLPPLLQSVLASLSVFAAPFSAEWACALRRDATPDALRELTAAGYLHRTGAGDTYCLPQAVRERVWNALEPEPRRVAERAYFRVTNDWLNEQYESVRHLSKPERRERWREYAPHFAAVTQIVIKRKPTLERVRFVAAVHQHGFRDAAWPARAWLESAAQNTELPIALQAEATELIADISLYASEFDAATLWLGHYLMLVPNPKAAADLIYPLDKLAVTLHHKGDYDRAILFAREALRQSEALGDLSLLAHSLFVWAEVGYSSGFLTESLPASNRCVVLYETLNHGIGLPPALYQNGVIRHASGDTTGALSAWNRAAPLFLARGEDNGVADCLRMMATVRLEQGALGEATLHAAQARALYERLGVAGSRAAILEVQGDIKKAQNDPDAARVLYAESLCYWQGVAHPRWIARSQKRLLAVAGASDTSAATFGDAG